MTRPGNFLFIVRSFPKPDKIVGGRSIRPYEVVNCLRRIGHKVQVFETEEVRGLRSFRPNSSVGLIVRELLRILLLPPVLMSTLMSFGNNTGKEENFCLLKIPSNISATLLSPLLAILLVIVCRIRRIKIWSSVHDLSPEHQQYILRSTKYDVKFRLLALRLRMHGAISYLEENILLKNADLVTVVSSEMKERVIHKHRLDSRKVSVLRASVNPSLASNVKDSEEKDSVKVMTIGSLVDVDVDLLIEATRIARLSKRGITLLLVGRGDLSALGEICRNHPWVKYCGEGTYTEFPNLVDAADILVIPQTKDPYIEMAWQLKVPMYLASGRPTIITRTKEIENYLEHREVCIVCDNTPTALAKSMILLASNPKLRSKLARKAQEFALRELTWEVTVRKVLDHFEEMYV